MTALILTHAVTMVIVMTVAIREDIFALIAVAVAPDKGEMFVGGTGDLVSLATRCVPVGVDAFKQTGGTQLPTLFVTTSTLELIMGEQVLGVTIQAIMRQPTKT